VPDAEGPDAPPDGAGLSEPERRLLAFLQAATAAQDETAIAAATGLADDTTRGGLQRLRSKRLARVEETSTERRRLTTRGRSAVDQGLPERRFLTLLRSRGGSIPAADLVAGPFDEEERAAAIGGLRRRGLLAEGAPFRLTPAAADADAPWPEETALLAVRDGAADAGPPAVVAGLVRRGLVAVDRVVDRRWSVAPDGADLPLTGLDRPLIGALTPAVLASGAWRDGAFRPYDVRAEVPYVTGARPHPYLAWLRQFEEVLVGLGFEEGAGPLLETAFWNADVLFMPQDHPARSIHDAFSLIGTSGHPPDPALLARVAAVHEGRPVDGATPLSRGWGGTYDPVLAARPVLRSQTTAVSARFLAAHPTPPFRMYAVDRNFRREAVDATHHLEFAQCEGIVGQEGITLRHLIGIFRSLAEGIGIRDVRFRPTYFPFTEPSVEGHVKHPRLGWIEVLPGGIFRPEVLRPLGIDVPVAAWGIGVMRLAMVALGVNDIRDLYLDDLARLTGGRL